MGSNTLWGLMCGLGLLAPAAAPGLVWRWSNPAPHGNNLIDLAVNGNLAVQVTEQGQVYTSYDGRAWLPGESHTTNSLQAVAFLGERILVTGENGTALYSDDGANFVYTNLQTTDWLVGLAASPSLAVAVGDNAAVYTSADGAVWQRQAAPPQVGANWLLSVAWGAGTFVTVGEGGYIATSTNGINWTQRPPILTENLTRVAWLGGEVRRFPESGFWAVSQAGSVIVSTNNGATWRKLANVNSTNLLYAIAGNDTTRLIAGDQEARLGVAAGSTGQWTSQTGALPPTAPVWTYYTGLWDTNRQLYLLGGKTGMLVEGSLTNNAWAWDTPFLSLRDWLWQVTAAPGFYVAVGDHARVLTSLDGIDWTPEMVPYTNSISLSNTVFLGVGGSSNCLIAVGSQGSLAVSTNNYLALKTTNTDGTVTTNLASTLGVVWHSLPRPTTNDLSGVGFWSNRFYAVGGLGTILASPNASNWTRAASAPTTAFLSAIEPFPGGLAVVGDLGTILTSPDGATWTPRTSNTTNWLYRLHWANGSLVAVGENGTIRVSTDGIQWRAANSGATAWLNEVTTLGDTWYVVGTAGTVLSSTNLTDWTRLGTITPKSLFGAASLNGQLIVAGVEGVVLRAQVIPDLTPVKFLDFKQAGGYNVFMVGGKTGQRFTFDASPDLAQWTTGPVLEIFDHAGTFIFSQGVDPARPAMFYRATLAP